MGLEANERYFREHFGIEIEDEAAVPAPARTTPAQAEDGARSDLPPQEWPSPLAQPAFHDVAGEFLGMVAPHTEADPAAVLIQFLVAAGNMVGRSVRFTAETTHHYTNLNALIVGRTSRGRKGSSFAPTRRLLEAVDEDWSAGRVQSGLSSGEGLIYAVRDPVVKRDEDGEEKVIDDGASDRRLLVVEEEFAAVLRVARRDGNILSQLVRKAWDGATLQTLTRNAPLRATGAHVSVLGHITLEELARELADTDVLNGFGNRFLWVLAKRSKLLPDGGRFHEQDIRQLADALAGAATFARRTAGDLPRDREARELWHAVYPELTAEVPGLLGAVTSRAEAIVGRLALIYAILDRSAQVKVEHLEAALAVWRYSFDSARVIFGVRTGDPVADRIAEAVEASEDGLTRTEIRDLLGRHAREHRIETAIRLLETLGRVERVSEDTGGRPVERVRPKRQKGTA